MQTKNEKHLLAKVAAVMLLSFATVGGTYSVQAAGLTGSYVGIGKAPASANVVDKGSEVKSTEEKIIDYRQTYNSASSSNMSRTPKNNNANGEGVDGVSSGNDIDGAGTAQGQVIRPSASVPMLPASTVQLSEPMPVPLPIPRP